MVGLESRAVGETCRKSSQRKAGAEEESSYSSSRNKIEKRTVIV